MNTLHLFVWMPKPATPRLVAGKGPTADLLQGFQQTFTHSGIVRIGNHGPKQAHDRAASCPDPPAQCNFINGLYNPSVTSSRLVAHLERLPSGAPGLHAVESAHSCALAEDPLCWLQDNDHTLRGALVEGSTTGFDTWPDTRTLNESRVAIEYNAGYTSALAAFEELESPTWPQCLQGFGYFSTVRTRMFVSVPVVRGGITAAACLNTAPGMGNLLNLLCRCCAGCGLRVDSWGTAQELWCTELGVGRELDMTIARTELLFC